MELTDQVIIVTGAGRGIGAALCRRFAAEAPAAIVVTDLDNESAERVAADVNALDVAVEACGCDVSDEQSIRSLVERVEARFGRVDVFCSNAGGTTSGGCELPDSEWQRQWDLHVMSNVYAARAVLPGMRSRQSGYLLQTASAAGLLTEIGSAPYSVTKHATIALAEWLSVQHRREGIRVSCICPMGVDTDMLDQADPIHQFLAAQSVTAEHVAEQAVEGMRDERFLILPHPEVLEFFSWKGGDYDRWLHGMSRLRQKLQR